MANKSLPAIQVGNDIYEIKDLTAREHMIEVRDDQPTSEDNKVWIREENETSPIAVEIPGKEDDFTIDLGNYPYLEVGNIQYKKPNGDYVGVHVVAEKSTEEHIQQLKDEETRIKTTLQQLIVWKTEKGRANGVATLDGSGKVPSSQLPSYVDDVLEGYINPTERSHITHFYKTRSGTSPNYTYSNPYTPESDKIYVDINDIAGYVDRIYRWSGTYYVEVSNPKDMIHDANDLSEADKYNYVWSIGRVSTELASDRSGIKAINDARGAANGIATLDENVKVPVAQLQNLINDNGGVDTMNQTWTADKLAKFYTEFKTFEYYTAIQISEVSLTVVGGRNNLAEKGSTVTGLSLKYKVNQAPHKVKINGTEITPTPSATEYTITEDSTDSESTHYLGLPVVGNTAKNYDVYVTDLIKIDDPDTSRQWVSRRATLTFTNKVKYGAAQDPRDSGGTIDDAFLNGLSDRVLSTGKVGTISVNAPGLTNYVWYALPSSYGECQFTVGVLTGGFTEVAKFNHQNESGFTTEYRVYRSVKGNLGSQTIKVT